MVEKIMNDSSINMSTKAMIQSSINQNNNNNQPGTNNNSNGNNNTNLLSQYTNNTIDDITCVIYFFKN